MKFEGIKSFFSGINSAKKPKTEIPEELVKKMLIDLKKIEKLSIEINELDKELLGVHTLEEILKLNRRILEIIKVEKSIINDSNRILDKIQFMISDKIQNIKDSVNK